LNGIWSYPSLSLSHTHSIYLSLFAFLFCIFWCSLSLSHSLFMQTLQFRIEEALALWGWWRSLMGSLVQAILLLLNMMFFSLYFILLLCLSYSVTLFNLYARLFEKSFFGFKLEKKRPELKSMDWKFNRARTHIKFVKLSSNIRSSAQLSSYTSLPILFNKMCISFNFNPLISCRACKSCKKLVVLTYALTYQRGDTWQMKSQQIRWRDLFEVGTWFFKLKT